jgi:hypothetical protein
MVVTSYVIRVPVSYIANMLLQLTHLGGVYG